MANLTRAYGQRPPTKPAPPAPAPERVTSSVVKVNSTPAPVGTAESRTQVTVFNTSTEEVFLGGSSVSPTTGLPVQPSGYASLDISADVVLYAVTAFSSPVELRVLEIDDAR